MSYGAGRRAEDRCRSRDPAEAMYPNTRKGTEGETLDASKHNYTLTFPAGQLPPVNAFWSVTVWRREPAPDREPDQLLSHQLADAA